ncbi:MAG: Fic family protein [Methanomassiliicoccaceae archaeon]|nr:Fic family protein [Methanomassiliicoccaceae archaeon]MCL2145726.1 Fic family protein [Methanomassiliicoccaceae archaeon]
MEQFNVEVLKDIHRKVIDKGSAEEQSLRDNVRDEGTLHHIAASSWNISDPVARAAFLLHRVATQHPFMEGNKRTAWTAAMSILRAEGYYIEENSRGIDVFVRRVASGDIEEQDIVKWFKERMRSLAE